jgi:hypothetical protein
MRGHQKVHLLVLCLRLMQCYDHVQSRQAPYQFRPMECVSTGTRLGRFNILPSDSLDRYHHQVQFSL